MRFFQDADGRWHNAEDVYLYDYWLDDVVSPDGSNWVWFTTQNDAENGREKINYIARFPTKAAWKKSLENLMDRLNCRETYEDKMVRYEEWAEPSSEPFPLEIPRKLARR